MKKRGGVLQITCCLVLMGLVVYESPQVYAEKIKQGQSDIWPKIITAIKPDPGIEKKIELLLARMTLEQKVGQMIQGEIRWLTPDDVKQYHLGSVLNGGGAFPNNNKYSSVQDWVSLADDFYYASMDTSDDGMAIPIMWGTDAVHGHNNVIGATLFPHNIALGATRNSQLIKKIAQVTAREVLVSGIDWIFASTVAVARDDRWGRSYESYSEDPELVRLLAGKLVEGFQGQANTDTWLDHNHVIATAKHFIGDGGTQNGIDQGDTLASEIQLRDIHGAGYFETLQVGVQTVMSSFSSWQGQKLHGHKYLLTDVLKHQMGFDGFVVGDWNGHGQLSGCSVTSCAEAINAGVDMLMAPEHGQDLSFLSRSRGALRLQIKLDEHPTAPVNVKLVCNSSCADQKALTNTLSELPLGKWQSLTIELGCHSISNTHYNNVHSAFSLETAGRMILSVANI